MHFKGCSDRRKETENFNSNLSYEPCVYTVYNYCDYKLGTVRITVLSSCENAM